MRDLHTLLLETQVMEGKMVCGNCGHEYKIKEGIANFLLPNHLGERAWPSFIDHMRGEAWRLMIWQCKKSCEIGWTAAGEETRRSMDMDERPRRGNRVYICIARRHGQLCQSIDHITRYPCCEEG